MILAAAGAEPVTKTIPYGPAYAAASAMEAAWRLARITSEPPLTLFVLQQLTTAHWFNISAARRDLGYNPNITIEQGMKRLGEWLTRKLQLITLPIEKPEEQKYTTFGGMKDEG
jgi:nucleoside-diphosphate-sugar epimerase